MARKQIQDIKEEWDKQKKSSDLEQRRKKKLTKVDIVVKLIDKEDPRYPKGFKVVTFTAGDPTGTILIPFWNNDINTVKIGDVIEIENGYITEFNKKLQLNVGKYGKFRQVTPPEGFEVSNVPAVSKGIAEEDVIPIEQLESRTKNLTVKVFVKDLVKEQTVTTRKDGRQHRVSTFLVGDQSGCILLSLWDEWIDLVEKGTIINIQNAYIRIYQGQRFLNLARNAKINLCPTTIKINLHNNLSEKLPAESGGEAQA